MPKKMTSWADTPHYEAQYLDLMADIWANGDERVDRTGIGTRSLFGQTLRFSLADDAIPLLTTKRVYWKTAARELLWFLTGNTNIRPLIEQGVRIWSDWPHAKYVRETGDALDIRAFEGRILEDAGFAEKWGDLGPVYGAQWVNWPRYTALPNGDYRRESRGINQISALIDSLIKNPASRRHIFTGWNVADLDHMALPPCHMTYQFHVTSDGGLSCMLFQRSCDVALGLPFNLFEAALLTRMLAQQTGLYARELIWSGGDVHVYLNHAQLVQEQVLRIPGGAPKLRIINTPSSIFDYRIEDFVVEDYAPQAAISAPIAV
jgi:thymidylate synthase